MSMGETKRWVWLSLFAVSMAYLESSVVVYLRQVYYPEGFHFPIVMAPVGVGVIVIELGRELSTVVMLLAVAVLAGRDRLGSFLLFCYLFGLWDIFYYVWLKVFLNWPGSLLTWDILFLLPLPWLGPVLAPVLVSVGLIGGSVTLLWYRARGVPVEIPGWAWALEIAAALIIVLSFVWDWRLVLEGGVPTTFPWWLFGIGMGLGIGVFVVLLSRLPRRPIRLAH